MPYLQLSFDFQRVVCEPAQEIAVFVGGKESCGCKTLCQIVDMWAAHLSFWTVKDPGHQRLIVKLHSLNNESLVNFKAN